MSHSTLWAVYKTKVTPIAEYSNGHGSAPPIWDLLWSKHVNVGYKFPWTNEKRQRLLWDLWKDPLVPQHHRLALMFTLDKALLKLSMLGQMAEALDLCHTEILNNTCKWESIGSPTLDAEPPSAWTWTHLPAIAKHLRTIDDPSLIPPCDSGCNGCDKTKARNLAQTIKRKAIGIGLGCTSVCDPFSGMRRPVDETFYIALQKG